MKASNKKLLQKKQLSSFEKIHSKSFLQKKLFVINFIQFFYNLKFKENAFSLHPLFNLPETSIPELLTSTNSIRQVIVYFLQLITSFCSIKFAS